MPLIRHPAPTETYAHHRTRTHPIRTGWPHPMFDQNLRSRSSRFLIIALSLVSCVAEISTSDAARIARERASTIAVVPLNLALPLAGELESSIEIVWDALLQHVEARTGNSQQLGYRLARALWLESIEEIQRTGSEQSFESAAMTFARRVSKEIEFDAIIIPSLYLQNAKVGPRAARWDSATQEMEFIGQSRWEIEMPAISTVPAASIHVYVVDSAGRPLHSRRTGVELIQHMEIHVEKRRGHDKRTWILVNDKPAIDNAIRVRAAIAHALSPFLSKER